ncbi:MAG: insulinase family protein [Planctomycetes bacterium]|nr:insulinase family protein [Planctomycetota bacterium]MBI3848327.1 insulinase family protein [Planctomycetota bacterium]
MRNKFTLLTLATLAFATAALAGDPRKVTTVEGITEYDLDNGLRVLLFPDDSKPTVTVNATYLVGSRHEGYGETGMAHLLEHMLFKGTPKHPHIWKDLQDHGAQFNGSTSFDRTNYFETMSASDENLEFGLDLEADRMVYSTIAKRDLESEFTVVRNEFEMGENNPGSILSERVMSTAYIWHNYGKSTIGSREDIERVPIERLQAFYRKFYQPDNCVLVVAGKFDPTKTLERINATYGAIPKATRQLEQTYTWEPTQDGEREVTLRRVGDAQELNLVYHVCAGTHEDCAPIQILADVLDADKTGRLYKALIETGLATRVSASAQALHDPGVLEVSVQARLDQSLPEIRKRTLEVLDGLGAATFTDEEVTRAKRVHAKSFDQLMSDTNRVGVSISEWAAAGDWRLLFVHRDRIQKVTPADVKRVAAKYLKASNRTIGTFTPDKAPDRAEIPQNPDVAALVRDYRGGAEMTKGAAFEATYAGIEAATKRSTLPGGMKLALLPKQTRNDRVQITLALHYGTEADFVGKQEAAGYVGRMLMRGTTKHTQRQIQDRLDELKANVNVGGFFGGGRGGRGGGGGPSTPGSLDVSVQCSRTNLAEVLDLAAEILREPAFPADEFDKIKKEALAGQEQRLSDPAAIASNELQRRLNPVPPTSIRYVPTLTEQIERTKAVTLDQVKAIYKDLVGASFSEAAAVGDFDPAELTAALQKHFDDWKSPKPFARIERKYIPTKPDTLVFNTPDKANALFIIGSTAEIRDDDADYPALFMANYILGGMSNSRFMNRIRQKEGLSYGSNAGMQVSSQDRNGGFVGTGICAPQNAEKALACGLEEMDKLIKEGVPQQELDDARKGYHQSLEVQLSNDGGVAGMLASGLYLGRTLKFNEDNLKKIDALEPKDLSTAFAKYVKLDKLVTVRAGDFSKKSDATPATPGGSQQQGN